MFEPFLYIYIAKLASQAAILFVLIQRLLFCFMSAVARILMSVFILAKSFIFSVSLHFVSCRKKTYVLNFLSGLWLFVILFAIKFNQVVTILSLDKEWIFRFFFWFFCTRSADVFSMISIIYFFRFILSVIVYVCLCFFLFSGFLFFFLKMNLCPILFGTYLWDTIRFLCFFACSVFSIRF